MVSFFKFKQFNFNEYKRQIRKKNITCKNK